MQSKKTQSGDTVSESDKLTEQMIGMRGHIKPPRWGQVLLTEQQLQMSPMRTPPTPAIKSYGPFGDFHLRRIRPKNEFLDF